MTKLKKKNEYSLPGGCFNCKFSDEIQSNNLVTRNTQMICILTNKVHNWEYSCKKWRK